MIIQQVSGPAWWSWFKNDVLVWPMAVVPRFLCLWYSWNPLTEPVCLNDLKGEFILLHCTKQWWKGDAFSGKSFFGDTNFHNPKEPLLPGRPQLIHIGYTLENIELQSLSLSRSHDKSKRIRALMFPTPCTFCLWWDGTHCQSQEASINGCHQAKPVIQSNISWLQCI